MPQPSYLDVEYCIFALGAALLLCGLGLGLTIWILPDHLQRYALIFSPTVGYCYASIGCWHLYHLGLKINGTAALLLLIPAAAALVAACLKKSASVRQAFSSAPVAWACVVAGAAFFAISIPVFATAGGLTTVSLFGHDAAQYATVARFFAEFGRGSTLGFPGEAGGWFDEAADYGYFGAFVFPATLGSFFNLMPHQTLSLCVNLFAAITALSIFPLLQGIFRASHLASLAGVGLVGFHPILLYVSWQIFLAQVLGMAIATTLLCINCHALEERERSHWIRHSLLCALLFNGLLLTYQHMLPFVLFFIATYAISLACVRKSTRCLKIALVVNSLGLIGALLLSPLRLAALTRVLKDTATNNAGWFVPFAGPEYLTTMSVQIAPHVLPGPHLALAIGAGCLLVLWLILGLCYGERNANRLSFIIATLAIYAGCIALAKSGSALGDLGNYKSFKLASFFLPCFLCVIAASFGLRHGRWKRVFLLCDVILLLALASGCFIGERALLRRIATANLRVESDYKGLLTVDRDADIPSVNILGNNGWKLMWSTYFLMHKTVYMEGRSYYPASALRGAYSLVDATDSAPDGSVARLEGDPVRIVNARFNVFGPVQSANHAAPLP